MSINIRYLTNGEKKIYVVRHTDTGEREIYNTRDEVPECNRHYAPTGEPVYTKPDMARILGVQDILYPDFPKCKMLGYESENCIAESCINAEPTYKDCPYIDKTYGK